MATDPDEARDELVERLRNYEAEHFNCSPEEVRMDAGSVNWDIVMLVMAWYEEMIEEEDGSDYDGN